jgi:hypothetical protein
MYYFFDKINKDTGLLNVTQSLSWARLAVAMKILLPTFFYMAH